MDKVNVLDHGYIQYIEHWGSDERIIEAARMSTGKGFLGWEPGVCPTCNGIGRDLAYYDMYSCNDCNGTGKIPGDLGLLRRLWIKKHCYDEITEVLTRSRGFVKWPEVNQDDELGQWDENLSSLIYEKPFELIKHYHRGRMYKVDHGGVDLLVTDNHKMLVKKIVSVPGENRQEWCSQWSLVSVSDLDHKSMIRYRKHAAYIKKDNINLSSDSTIPTYPEHNDTRSLLRLIGFFIGDGCALSSSTNSISFHLRKPRKISFLREVCCEVGWELSELSNDNYVVRANGIGNLFKSQFYNNKEKFIPSYLLDMNKDDSQAMLSGLRESDGSIKRSTWEYHSTSKQVAESVQRLVLHSGGSAHISHRDKISRVMILSRMLEPVVNQSKRNTSWVEEFNGNVYCAHTRTGILVVRRNGKIVLSGNSTPFEMAGMIVEVSAPIMVFREWHRHRTQSYNEMSGRYVPLPNINYIPSVERLLLNKGTKNQQASAIKGSEDLDETGAAEYQKELYEMWEYQEKFYQKWLNRGVPKELARSHIGVGRYSRMRASSNLRNWLAFLILRMAEDAQYEIRQYAQQLCIFLQGKFPRTLSLFMEGKDK